MQRLLKFFSFLAALAGFFIIWRPKDGFLAIGALVPRLLSMAFAPFWMILGFLGAGLGIRQRSLFSLFAGLFGAIVTGRHIVKINQAPVLHHGTISTKRERPDLLARLPKQRLRGIERIAPVVSLQTDVVYAIKPETGLPLLADLWLPPSNVPPTGLGVIYLHGGGWVYGDKGIGTYPLFDQLARQGHAILDVAYTLAPQADLHQMMADVKRAVAWMKQHGTGYNIDADKLVLMGASAGAHLALLAGYAPNDPYFEPDDIRTDTSVAGVISYYGVADLFAAQDYLQAHFRNLHTADLPFPLNDIVLAPTQWLPNLLGGDPNIVPEAYRLASPLTYVSSKAPPTLLIQGQEDILTGPEGVTSLYAALQEANVPVTYINYPQADHGFDLIFPVVSPVAQAALYEVSHFLAKLAS